MHFFQLLYNKNMFASILRCNYVASNKQAEEKEVLFLLKYKIISNHSNYIVLVKYLIIFSLFLSSCSQDLFTPERTEIEITNLYKTHLDSEIESIEKYIVQKNIDGEIEVPVSFVTSWSFHHVIYLINSEEEYWLDRKVVDILSMNGNIAVVTGIEEGLVLLINPLPTMRKLFKIDSDNLRYKFDMGRAYGRK